MGNAFPSFLFHVSSREIEIGGSTSRVLYLLRFPNFGEGKDEKLMRFESEKVMMSS